MSSKGQKWRESELTPDEFFRLMSHDDRPDCQALWIMLWFTGCRIGELCRNMKREHVRFEGNDMMFIRVWPEKRHDRHYHDIPIKFINTDYGRWLADWLLHVPAGEALWPVTTRTAERWFDRAARSAKIDPKPHIHLFRKTRLQTLANKGATAHQIKAWAGHKSIQSSDHYVSASAEQVRKIGDEIT